MKKIILIFLIASCSKIIDNLNIKNKDINNDLVKAVIDNDKNKFIELINKGANINYSSDGKTILDIALDNKSLNIIKFFIKKFKINKENIIKIYDLALDDFNNFILDIIKYKYKLEEGAIDSCKYFLYLCYTSNKENVEKFINENNINPIKAQNKSNQNALIAATLGNKIETFKMLIEKYNLNINFKDKNGITSLIIASGRNYSQLVEAILDKGANINHKSNHKFTALMAASHNGNLNIVKHLLEKGAKVNERDSNGLTSLMLASKKGREEAVKTLIEAKANINIKSNFGNTALMLASKNGHIEVVRTLIEKKIDVNEKNRDENSALMIASKEGYLEIVKLLIEKNAYINDTNDKSNMTSLMLSAQYGHSNIVEYLLKNGAKINAKTNAGDTALILASKNNQAEVVKILIKAEANINEKENFFDRSSLIISLEKGHLEIAKLLIEKGANVNEKDSYARTPLTLASQKGYLEIVKLLIEKGANVNEKNSLSLLNFMISFSKGHSKYAKGLTALMLASGAGNLEIVRFLITKGSNVNDKSNDGFTPLMIASQNGYLETVKFLIAEKALINTRNNFGNTALIFASKNGYLEIVKFLLKKRVNINNKNKIGRTALILACLNGHAEVMRTLIEKGADIEDSIEEGFLTKSALEIAYENDYKDILELLISKGANLGAVKNISLEEILIKNIKNGEINNCLLMLEKYKNKINYNYRDKEGNNLLHYTSVSDIMIFREILKRGSDINCVNNKGETPLYKALCLRDINEDFVIYIVDEGAILKPNSHVGEKTLISVIAPYKKICDRLVYKPLIDKLLENNFEKINPNQEFYNKIKDIIKTLNLKEEDFQNSVQMIKFIKNILIDLPFEIDLDKIVIKEESKQDVELNIEVFDEIFRHFEDEDYWDSIIKKAVDYVIENYIKELDQISLEYLDCIKNKGLDYVKSNFNLDRDKKLNINKLIKEKINYIKNIFKGKLQRLQNTEPINKSLLEMDQKEREQNTDFQRKKQLSNLLKMISLMAVQGDNYDKIKFSINQILDIMVCREGSLEALNEAIRYISLGEIVEVDHSIKNILDEELMKLRYELFKEVINQEINENKIKLSILLDGRKVEIKAEMVPELLPSILKTMYDDLKIKLEYLDSDDNYNFIYNKEYIIEEVKRRYKDRIISYVIDKIENNKILWTKVRDYIEKNIFEGRPYLEIEDFVYNEYYKIKEKSIKALLLYLSFLK